MRIDLETIDHETHVLRETFGDPARWGIPSPMTPEWRLAAGALSQLILGADGKISAAEREASMAFGRFLGMSGEEEKMLRAIDPKTARIEEHAKPFLRPALGVLLYGSVAIARVDGFHLKEFEACERVCRALGVDPAVIVPMEALMTLDDVARQNRHRLIDPPVDLANAGAGPMIAEGGIARATEYGFGPGPMPLDFARRFGQGALSIASGDGGVNETEMRWFIAHMRHLGAPRELLEEFVAFEPSKTPLDTILDARMKPFARAALLLGLRTARADGIDPRERSIAEQAAKILGYDAAFVTALECQLRMEEALRDARIKLVAQASPSA